MRLNKFFLISIICSLLPILLWFILAHGTGNPGITGFYLLFAYLYLFSLLCLSILPFLWISLILFLPLIKNPSAQIARSMRFSFACVWAIMSPLLAGCILYSLHHFQVLQPIQERLSNSGALYLITISGIVVSLVGVPIIFGIKSLTKNKNLHLGLSNMYYAIGVGIISFVGVIGLDIKTTNNEAITPNFALFTLRNDYQNITVQPSTLYFSGPKSFDLHVDGEIYKEAKSLHSTPLNPKLNLCVPGNYAPSRAEERQDYQCAYAFMSKNGLKVYRSIPLPYKYFYVLGETFIVIDSPGGFPIETIDALVPARLNGNQLIPLTLN